MSFKVSLSLIVRAIQTRVKIYPRVKGTIKKPKVLGQTVAAVFPNKQTCEMLGNIIINVRMIMS